MPRHSDTGNVKKLCGCARGKRWSCSHPWYVDFKAPKDHATRSIAAGQPVRVTAVNGLTLTVEPSGAPAQEGEG